LAVIVWAADLSAAGKADFPFIISHFYLSLASRIG
jgi:hypothetical protein